MQQSLICYTWYEGSKCKIAYLKGAVCFIIHNVRVIFAYNGLTCIVMLTCSFSLQKRHIHSHANLSLQRLLSSLLSHSYTLVSMF